MVTHGLVALNSYTLFHGFDRDPRSFLGMPSSPFPGIHCSRSVGFLEGPLGSAWARSSGVGKGRAKSRRDDRRRFDLVIYGAMPVGGALCCDTTLVSRLTRTGQPQLCTALHDGALLRVGRRRLLVLG